MRAVPASAARSPRVVTMPYTIESAPQSAISQRIELMVVPCIARLTPGLQANRRPAPALSLGMLAGGMPNVRSGSNCALSQRRTAWGRPIAADAPWPGLQSNSICSQWRRAGLLRRVQRLWLGQAYPRGRKLRWQSPEDLERGRAGARAADARRWRVRRQQPA